MWAELDKDESSVLYEEYALSKSFECPKEYEGLKRDIEELFNKTLNELKITVEEISKKNNSYQVDLVFGLKLYLLLNGKYGMNVRAASSAGIWRFLSLKVVPHIVEKRCGIEHPDKFWKKPKRIWLRTIWWYIYLSWQGSEKETFETLKYNNTDTILQLVDRCGRTGYRVDMTREFLKQYGKMDPVERRKKDIFRKVMVFNTARVQAVEPALVLGGEEQYIEGICNYFLKN